MIKILGSIVVCIMILIIPIQVQSRTLQSSQNQFSSKIEKSKIPHQKERKKGEKFTQNHLLVKFKKIVTEKEKEKIRKFFIDDFDYHKLKLFFISVLWRASISNHKFYNRVKLGPYEEKARKMILGNEPGPEDDFAVVVAKFSDPEFMGMLDPHLDRFENINFLQVLYNRVCCVYKS